jgi:hypothetical protein
VGARRRYEGAETSQEFVGGEYEGVLAVAEGAFHSVAEGAVLGLGQAVEGESGACAVATELFESLAVVGVDGAICV